MDGPWFALPAEPDPGVAAAGRAERTRALLVATAAARFAGDGYHGTALREILAEAGVTKGALYFHFGSKLELARAVCDEAARAWKALLDVLAARRLDPLQELLVEGEATFLRFSQDLPFRAALRIGAEAVEFDGMLARWRGLWEARTEALFERARAEGLVARTADPRTLGRHVVALMLGHQSFAAHLPAPDDAWTRMNESWTDVLVLIASSEWLAAWHGSGWHERRSPCPTPPPHPLGR